MSVDAEKEKDISIHTFLAEGDEEWGEMPIERQGISIHTFLAEGDMAVTSPQVEL